MINPKSMPFWSNGPLPDSYWLTGSSLDPSGRAFFYKDEIYRIIKPEAVDNTRALFSKGIVSELVERGLLVPTEISDIPAPGGGLILRHERVPFLTGPHEWCRLQLKDVGLAWLDLNLALARHGLATVDAQPPNFGQMGRCRPTWIDFGSIGKLETGDQTILEFRRFYKNPLHLASKSRGLARLARAINQTGGIDDYELSSLKFSASPVAGRQMQNAYDRFFSTLRNLRKRMGKPRANQDPAKREKLLREERDALSAMTFPSMTTRWGNYHKSHLLDDLSVIGNDPRRAAIIQTIEKVNPKRLIDLASNAGLYSFFAAQRGTQVLALDYDEKAVERMYEHARAESAKMSIAAACADVTKPPYERLNLKREADFVLALALTHHLTLHQGTTMPYVVDLLAQYTTRYLLVEFMPNGVGCTVPMPDPLPEWYRQDAFETELRRKFETVTVVAEFREPAWRVLYLAETKR